MEVTKEQLEMTNEIIDSFLKKDLLDYWFEKGEMVYTIKEKYKKLPFSEIEKILDA